MGVESANKNQTAEDLFYSTSMSNKFSSFIKEFPRKVGNGVDDPLITLLDNPT